MFQIIISEKAIKDITSIREYIEKRLSNPISADSFYEELRSKILSLTEFPGRFSRILIGGLYYHRMPVKSFNVYYCVNQNSQTVTIARVLYSGMDINQVAIIN